MKERLILSRKFVSFCATVFGVNLPINKRINLSIKNDDFDDRTSLAAGKFSESKAQFDRPNDAVLPAKIKKEQNGKTKS